MNASKAIDNLKQATARLARVLDMRQALPDSPMHAADIVLRVSLTRFRHCGTIERRTLRPLHEATCAARETLDRIERAALQECVR